MTKTASSSTQKTSVPAIGEREFRQRLKALMDIPVTDMDCAGKQRLVREYLAEASSPAAPAPTVEIIPFSHGKRPIDEALHHGYGCSESVGVLSSSPEAIAINDEIWLLYQLKQIEMLPAPLTPEDLDVRMSLWFVPPTPEMGDLVPVPGMLETDVPIQVISTAAYPQPVLEPGSFATANKTRYVAKIIPGEQLFPRSHDGQGWTWDQVDETLRQRTPDGADPYTFAHLFHQRIRVRLALYAHNQLLAQQSTEIEVYDAGRFGSLYARLLEQLIKSDTNAQARKDGTDEWHYSYHPLFPVLCIGSDKADLYMRAIVQDLAQQWDNLPDPCWLLRVGLYLEFLTCLGIFAAVADEYPNLLTSEEWQLFQHSPLFSKIRDRIDVAAWKKVWQMRAIAPPTADFLSAGPVSLLNLMRKQKATLEFLHAHHNDLKHAIELAGANHYNAQEIWHRVFRDAERAVLKNSLRAFPEIRHLDPRYREFFFWHQRGSLRLFGLTVVPARVSSVVGNQDGVFLSACRQYRKSMNDVAQWAARQELLDFTGSECIPKNASLLEAYIANNSSLLATLQKKDGYGPTLELSEPLPRDYGPALQDIEALLRRVPLFEPLMDDEIRELTRKVRPKRYGPFDRVVVQGQPGDSLFVVASGTLEVLVRQTDGHDLPIGICEMGSVFGEIALLMGGERTATVRAVGEAVLYEIGKAYVEPIIKARPQLIIELSVLMANRQADIAKHAQEYSSKQEQVKRLSQRMSAFLLGARTADTKKPLATLQKAVGSGRPLGLGNPLSGGDILRTDTIETLLRNVPVFKPLLDDEIRELAHMARLMRCRPFDRVITQGQPGASLFVVASGTLEVLIQQPDGRALSLNKLEPGSVFGETALLMGGERTATVRAVGEAVLYEIGKAGLQPIIEARPELIIELSVLMANRQADTAEQYQQYAATHEQVKSITQRMRSFLLGT